MRKTTTVTAKMNLTTCTVEPLKENLKRTGTLTKKRQRMENLFNTDFVTIVRKKGDNYVQEEINTRKMLPNSYASDQKVRENVIARLRKDPSVIVVLEDVGDRCDEHFEYKDFDFAITLVDGETPTGRMVITYAGEKAYDTTFPTDPAEESVWESPMEELLSDLTEILEGIDNECYFFVSKDCPAFEWNEPEEVVEDIYGITNLLEANGYEVERLHTIGYVSEPCLIAHENEVLMFGESHFYGNFFVEMKRVFQDVSSEQIKAAAKLALKGHPEACCFQHEDGSWGFRSTLSDDVRKSNVVTLLEEAVANLRDIVEKVEADRNVGEDILYGPRVYRALFTYEVIDASLKLSKLHI